MPPKNEQQAQEYERISKHSPTFPKSTGHQMHSASAKRENGLEADGTVDKDSGESSQKVLKLDFKRLHAKFDSSQQVIPGMKNVK